MQSGFDNIGLPISLEIELSHSCERVWQVSVSFRIEELYVNVPVLLSASGRSNAAILDSGLRITPPNFLDLVLDQTQNRKDICPRTRTTQGILCMLSTFYFPSESSSFHSNYLSSSGKKRRKEEEEEVLIVIISTEALLIDLDLSFDAVTCKPSPHVAYCFLSTNHLHNLLGQISLNQKIILTSANMH